MVGETLSHYRVLAKLGEGGMGVVYRAEDTRLHRIVALKLLPPAVTNDALLRQRLLHEARAAAAIQHPNIISIFEIGRDRDCDFIAMEYVEGLSLADLLRQGQLPEETIRIYATQIARALAKAHDAGVVHRDLKPGNIVVAKDNTVKLLDFGLAQRLPFTAANSAAAGSAAGQHNPAEAPTLTQLSQAGEIRGTVAYMSPEQGRGEPLDGRSDIFSFGILLYEMATGQRPFQGSSAFALLQQTVFEEPLPARQLRPNLPSWLDELIRACLTKSRDARPQTMHHVLAMLGKPVEEAPAIPGSSGTSSAPAPPREPAASTSPTNGPDPKPAFGSWLRSPLGLASASGLLVLVLALLGLVWTKSPETDPAATPDKALPSSTNLPISTTPTNPAPAAKKLIAVLPLQSMQNEPALRALSDGLTEVLASKLTELEPLQSNFSIIPTSEIRGRKIDSVEAARKQYGASLAITGSMLRLGDTIQVTANLVDAAQLLQLRATTFEASPTNLKALRDGLTTKVIELLALQIPEQAQQQLARQETERAPAYLAYLEGRGYLHRFDVAGNLDRAITSLEKAIAEDADYPLALAALGEAYWRKAKLSNDSQLAAKALQVAQRAVQKGGQLALPHVKLGEIYAQSSKAQAAIAEFQAALRVQPGLAEAYRGLGKAYATLGLWKEAEHAYAEGITQRPTDWYGYNLLGVAYFDQGKFPEAEAMFIKARELTPDNDYPYRNLGMVYLSLGRLADAQQQLERSSAIKPSFVATIGLGYLHYLNGRFPQAVAENRRAIALEPGNHLGWGNLADALWQQPDRASARQAYQRAIAACQARLKIAPNEPETLAYLATYQAKLGDRAGAKANLGQVPDLRILDVNTRFAVAIAHEVMGERTSAIGELQALVKDHFPATMLRAEPFLRALREDPQASFLAAK